MIGAISSMVKLATHICVVGNQKVKKIVEGFVFNFSRIRNSSTYKLLKKLTKDFC